MHRSSPSTSPHDKFLDQFEWDGGDWLYRYKMTGAAYRVTDAEKDRLVAVFDRQQTLWWWIGLPIVLAIAFGLIWITATPAPGSFLAAIKPLVAGTAWMFGLALRFVVDRFTFRIPLRALANRKPVAPAWSKEERQRLALDRIASAPLFGGALVCAIVLTVFLVEGGLTSGTGQIIIVCLAASLLLAAFTGYRKWQLARADAAVMSPTA